MSTSRHNAFTLVEMMMGLFIITLLLGAVEGALVMSAKSIPDGRSGTSATMIGSRAMDMMSQDFFYANGGTCTSATDVSITVPSRSGGSGNDTIRYYWDTTSSTTPLMRQVNGGTTVKIADNVQEFSLTYDKRQVQNPTSYGETSEFLLYSNDPVLPILATTTVTSSSYIGQYFKPTNLPSNANSWRITRVQFQARYHNSAVGQTNVQIRQDNGSGLPSSTVLDSVALMESSLPSSYAWQTVSFTKASGLTPGNGACILFMWVSDTNSCDIQSDTILAALTATNMLSSSNGTSWSSSLLQDLLFYAYGTASVPNPTSYSYYLTNVRADLLVGSDTHARLNTNMRVINEPQVN